jgi:hypothetical protein
MRNDGLTEQEGVVADHLFEATQAWLELPEEHPYEQDEFLASIHRLQDMLATRIARRLFPEGWPTYAEEDHRRPQEAARQETGL